MSVIRMLRAAGFAAGTALVLSLAVPAWAAPEGTITIAQPTDLSTLDPVMDISSTGLNVLQNIHYALTRIERDGSLVPLLAKSWKSSEDTKTWTFTLDERAKFSDGTPVTIQDVLWSFERVRDTAKSPMRPRLNMVTNMEIVDGNSIRMTLNGPSALFDRQMALLFVYSKAAHEKMGEEAFAKSPVGAGPFKAVEWVKDERIVLEAVPNHWYGEPKVKNIVFKPVPSEPARVAALQSGAVDVVATLPPALVERLQKDSSLKVVSVPSNRVVFIGMNVQNPILANVKLRQAIDIAVDREAIAKHLLHGRGVPVGQINSPVTYGADPTRKVTPYDPVKAKQLVKESGYKGETLSFSYGNNWFASADEVAQAIAGYLEEVGIKVKLDSQQYNSWYPQWTEKKMEHLFLMTYGPSLMDADLTLNTLFDSKPGRGYWNSPEIDKLILEQRGEADKAKRLKILAGIWDKMAENAIYAPIYAEVHSYAMTKKVDWTPRPDERLLFRDAALSK